MGDEGEVPLIQVTNVSPQTTNQQMRELFSYLGRIKELKVYPESDSAVSFPSKVCFVRFAEVASCQTALHLTNCVLVDRALIVVKSKYPEIPDETVALSLAAPAIAVANIGVQQPITHTAPLLPTPPSLFNMAGLGTSVLGNPPSTVAATVAALSAAIPGLAGLAPGMLQLPAMSVASVATSTAIMKPLISVMGTVVPQPPPLTGNVDPTKIEEIRRTVYVGNLSTRLGSEFPE
jgi:arginine/serine-rich splicing factor 12